MTVGKGTARRQATGQGTALNALLAVVAMVAVTAGTNRAVAQSEDAAPDPAQSTAVEPVTPSPPPNTAVVREVEKAKPTQPAAKKAAVAKKQEVLPWANAPLQAAAPTGDTAAADAASAQCTSLFEAACRDLKTCAWIGDVTREDGTSSPARCMARPPAPPKKAANKTPAAPAKPKKTMATTEAPAAEKSPAAATTPHVDAAETEAPAHEVVKKADAQKKGPIVVTAPPPANNSPSSNGGSSEGTIPSFGSIPQVGQDNAVVVTVPSSGQ